MREYHKIETVFNRDISGTKKLIEGDFRNETVKFLKDNQWVWTEKVDGTNIRVHWDGHRVQFYGRSDNSQIPARLIDYLVNTFSSTEAEELFEQKFGENEVTLYGEGYGVGIQKAGRLYNPDGVSFILFDVMVGDIWLRRDSVEDIAKAFGIDVVPIVGIGTIEGAVQYVKTSPKSTINAAVPMEGVVARPNTELLDRRGNRVIVKIKACDFR